MLIRKQSILDGKVREWEIPVTAEQLRRWLNGELIQKAMPNLTPDQREFIMTGITPAEWDAAFKDQ